MTTRERFHAVMNFEPFDRLPMVEWASWWDKTLDRWCAEGLPTRDRYELYRHFDLDLYRQDWIRSVHWQAPKPAHHGAGILEDEHGYEALRHHFFRLDDAWPVDPSTWTAWAEEQARGECVTWCTMDGFF